MTADPTHDPRTDRIIEVAIELAEHDGYDAVRLRDLAAKADVALGTVYRRFSSKEDILAAALERMVTQFHEAVMIAHVPGEDPAERLGVFFQLATQALAERPKLAAALFRTVASGVPELAVRVTSYQDTMHRILLAVYRGTNDASSPSDDEILLVRMLENQWFGAMVGWTGGLHSAEEAVDHVHAATVVILRALGSSREAATEEAP